MLHESGVVPVLAIGNGGIDPRNAEQAPHVLGRAEGGQEGDERREPSWITGPKREGMMRRRRPPNATANSVWLTYMSAGRVSDVASASSHPAP